MKKNREARVLPVLIYTSANPNKFKPIQEEIQLLNKGATVELVKMPRLYAKPAKPVKSGCKEGIKTITKKYAALIIENRKKGFKVYFDAVPPKVLDCLKDRKLSFGLISKERTKGVPTQITIQYITPDVAPESSASAISQIVEQVLSTKTKMPEGHGYINRVSATAGVRRS